MARSRPKRCAARENPPASPNGNRIQLFCRARYRHPLQSQIRHGFHGSFSFCFDDDIVAIPVWQRDITEHNVELLGVDHVQRAPSVISRGNIMAEMIQKPG